MCSEWWGMGEAWRVVGGGSGVGGVGGEDCWDGMAGMGVVEMMVMIMFYGG